MSNASLMTGETGAHLDRHLSPLIQEVIHSSELPGLAVGVVADCQAVYAKGFGFRRLGEAAPISMNTLFHMASISKPFVATAMVQLIEGGKVSLETRLVEALPYFKLDDERHRAITLGQMLSHISGMPDVEDYGWGQPLYDAGALERYVRSLSAEKMLSAPGESFAYSNMAFECLGDVIAKVSGMSFDDYVKAHILDPLGMAQSTFLKPERLPENWAAPHIRALNTFAWQGYPYNRMHGPSSTLHSSALEMCRWAIANLNRGGYHGQRILDQASYDLLWKPRAALPNPAEPQALFQRLHVGLSWFLGEYRREPIVEHGGGDTGFNTYFVMLPGRGMAVTVLCNLLPAPVRQIALAALDILLGHAPAPVLPPASLAVFRTLQQDGLEAGVAHWRALQAQRPAEYDFGAGQFDCLYNVVSLNRTADAGLIASLCAHILPEPDLREIEADFASHPSEAASAVVKAIREPRG
jgi:CubicO group peptidase (beta-lactamase class C family)